MNFLRGLLLVGSLLLASSTLAQKAPEPQVNLKDATLAVYHGKQVCDYHIEEGFFGPFPVWGCKFVSEFICTATVINRDGEADYVGLTTGHCFDWDKTEEYYVSSEVSLQPVLKKIKLVKFEYDSDQRYDFAVFTFSSLHEYPVVPVGPGEPPAIGTSVQNVNYSLGLVKQFIEGKVISDLLVSPADKELEHLKGRYLVNVGIGPGASGSAIVVDGRIVGLVEGSFPRTQMPTIVIPTGNTLLNFMDDDSAGLKPKAEPKKEKKPTLPEDESPSTRVVKWIRKYLLF